MSSKRFHYIMIGITGLLGVLIIVSVVLANNLLKNQSKELHKLKRDNLVLDAQKLNLAKAKADIAKYSELERQAKVIVPQDKDQAAVVREIVSLAKRSNITISAIQFPTSSLGSGSKSTVVKKSAPLTQTLPVPGLKGVYTLPVTVQVLSTPVNYSDFISFLSRLEQNRRTSQVSSISIQPETGNPNKINFTLVVNAYIKPVIKK